jgi:hypothetical protein
MGGPLPVRIGTRSDVCKTLTQSLTRKRFGHQAAILSKERTRRFQRVSL